MSTLGLGLTTVLQLIWSLYHLLCDATSFPSSEELPKATKIFIEKLPVGYLIVHKSNIKGPNKSICKYLTRPTKLDFSVDFFFYLKV